jgi:hypothetical protein
MPLTFLEVDFLCLRYQEAISVPHDHIRLIGRLCGQIPMNALAHFTP